MERFSHVDESGKARMVDVSAKPLSVRTATARGKIRLSPPTVALVRENALEKGDVLSVARIAGICGAKRASELIPLCHGIAADHVSVDLSVEEDGIVVEARAKCVARTGIEMEALTAVSIAALAIWDMCKAVDKSMSIGEITLVQKTKEAAS